MKKATRRFDKVIPNCAFVIKLFFRHLPGYSIASFVFDTFSSVLRVFRNTMIVKAVINTVQNGTDINKTLIYITIVAVLSLIQGLLGLYMGEVINPRAVQKMRKQLHGELFEQAIRLDIECYDDPEFYDEYVFANSKIIGELWGMFSSIKTVFASLVSVTTLFSTAFSVDAVGFVIGISSVIISFIFDTWRNNRTYKRDLEMIKWNREQSYASRIFSSPEYAGEIRVHHGFVGLMMSKYKNAVSMGKKVIKKHAPQIVLADSLTYFLSTYLLIYGIYCGYLVYKISVIGELHLDDFVGMYQAVRLLRNQIMQVTYSAAPSLKRHSMYIAKFREFLNYEPKITDVPDATSPESEFKEMSIKNVSFTYNTSDRMILNNIDIEIEKNQKIAIVGYNGAGKTTFVKLLMRLYDVNDGEICLNGKNIKKYKLREYRDSFGTIFQDYRLYATSIAENVVMDIYEEEYAESVKNALDKGGFSEKLSSLEDGLMTSLSKEFDARGVLLSGGESQKVAISRILFKHRPCIIMDEASSSLDPISEYNLNKLVSEAAENSMVICISHRLSTTVDADCIYMFENGRIVEHGTHAELIKLGGKYAEMFNIQAERYIKEKEISNE